MPDVDILSFLIGPCTTVLDVLKGQCIRILKKLFSLFPCFGYGKTWFAYKPDRSLTFQVFSIDRTSAESTVRTSHFKSSLDVNGTKYIFIFNIFNSCVRSTFWFADGSDWFTNWCFTLIYISMHFPYQHQKIKTRILSSIFWYCHSTYGDSMLGNGCLPLRKKISKRLRS